MSVDNDVGRTGASDCLEQDKLKLLPLPTKT